MPFKIGDEVYFECTVDPRFKGEGEVYNVDNLSWEWPYAVRFKKPIGHFSVRMFSEKELEFVKDDSKLSDWI
jgi:ribosomal protein L32E